jgi:hypothetical protein
MQGPHGVAAVGATLLPEVRAHAHSPFTARLGWLPPCRLCSVQRTQFPVSPVFVCLIDGCCVVVAAPCAASSSLMCVCACCQQQLARWQRSPQLTRLCFFLQARWAIRPFSLAVYCCVLCSRGNASTQPALPCQGLVTGQTTPRCPSVACCLLWLWLWLWLLASSRPAHISKGCAGGAGGRRGRGRGATRV